jgi:hypothetical protein
MGHGYDGISTWGATLTTTRNAGISISPTTEKDLRSLTTFFTGETQGKPEEFSDDELVASLLGWYLRNLPHPNTFEFKAVLQSFINRVAAATPDQNQGYRDYRSIDPRYTRGQKHSGGNVLTTSGITAETLDDIAYRVYWVSLLNETVRHDFGEHTGIQLEDPWLYCSLLPDQVIIDACVYGELGTLYRGSMGPNAGVFPYMIEEEIGRRAGQKTWDRPHFHLPNWPEPRVGHLP